MPGIKDTTIYNFPHAFLDKGNEIVLIKPLTTRMHQQLIRMYLEYEPRNSFDGLPPIQDDACSKWVQQMIDTGINLVAISFNKTILGHSALFPMNEGLCELFIVVSPKYQNRGIGMQLTRCIVQMAYEMGFEKIWLYGELRDQRGKHLYKKCGFEYLSNPNMDAVEMMLDLKQYQKTMRVQISQIMNRSVVALTRNSSCMEALDIFIKHNFGALPVIDEENRVVGILTATDLVMEANLRHRVGDILTMEVATVQEDAPVEQVIRLLQSKRLRCIPVLNKNNKLVGIVGRKDILSYYFLKFRVGLDFQDI